MDEYFTASHVYNQLKNYDIVNDIKYRSKTVERKTIFELYVTDYNTNFENEINKTFELYNFEIKRKETINSENKKYYKLIFIGLTPDI